MVERKNHTPIQTNPEFKAGVAHVLSYLEEVRGESISKNGRRVVPFIVRGLEALSGPRDQQEKRLVDLEARMIRARFGRGKIAWVIDTARDILPSWLYNRDFPLVEVDPLD